MPCVPPLSQAKAEGLQHEPPKPYRARPGFRNGPKTSAPLTDNQRSRILKGSPYFRLIGHFWVLGGGALDGIYPCDRLPLRCGRNSRRG